MPEPRIDACDVLVVGGGPAGSACAARLAAAGRDVVVLDRARFPRDKPCAGWITPEVMAALALDLPAYAARHTLQPITGFRVGVIGGAAHTIDYAQPVSYGIRRRELDAYLLERSGAGLELGQTVERIERQGGRWRLNDAFEAPVLVGAGGHFCPVARLLRQGRAQSAENDPLVVARETEFHLASGDAERCPVVAERPELYFAPDLAGYGWCFRKGAYLNVGLGRRDTHALPGHVAAFLAFLRDTRRLAEAPPDPWCGHAYRLREGPPQRLVGDGLLLVGDAAGLARAASGEGILTAVLSGQLAAEVLLEAGADVAAARLEAYARRLPERLGRPASATPLPAAFKALAGRVLLSSAWLTRQVVLDRLFLHRSGYAGGLRP